jgi:hypothetical protein
MEPKSYKCRFIQPGLISYDDKDQGTVLVGKPALDSMAPTFRNCPVIFIPNEHDGSDKTNSFNFSDLSANPASGLVTGIPYWGDDGWQYVEFTVWDEDAINAIDQKGFSVSCAYEVDEDKEGGEWHQIPYDSEVVNGHYLHMAIVARPRYEGSQIYANSKGGHGIMALFGMKKKNAAPAAAPAADKKPAQPAAVAPQHAEPDADNKPVMVNAETTVAMEDGTKVPLYELVEAYQMKQGDGSLPQELQDDDMISMPDGTQVSVADLKAKYSEMNGDGEEEAGEEGGEVEENAVTDTTDPKGEDDPNKKTVTNSAPAKRVVNQSLKNSAKNAEGTSPLEGIDTQSTRLERGKKLYSSFVANGNGGK